MARLGFQHAQRRYFTHPATSYLVEFPAGPLAVGDTLVRSWGVLETAAGRIQILTPTQCVMDRLAAYYHWKDSQALEQAVLVAAAHDVDLEALRAWSGSEGMTSRFDDFLRRLERAGTELRD